MVLQARLLVDSALNRFDHASPTDFGILALCVVILAWYMSRYLSD